MSARTPTTEQLIRPIKAHRVERFYLRCSCGMTVEQLMAAPPEMTLQEFTLWLETFLCKHASVIGNSNG